jgi:hypothetical protein
MKHFLGMTVFFCFLVLCCATMQVRASFEVEADSLSWSPVGTGPYISALA